MNALQPTKRNRKVGEIKKASSYTDAETEAFSRFINHHLKDDSDLTNVLPIDPHSSEIFSAVNDGIILCKLINLTVAGTIDPRAIVL